MNIKRNTPALPVAHAHHTVTMLASISAQDDLARAMYGALPGKPRLFHVKRRIIRRMLQAR